MYYLFCKVRVFLKLILRKFRVVPSFCKECGRNCYDFSVDDETWEKVQPLIKYGNVLCYDCFCRKCEQIGLPTVWQLSPQKKEEKINV